MKIIKEATLEDGIFRIKFAGMQKEEFFAVLDIIKNELFDRQYHPATRTWTCPNNQHNVNILKDSGFNLIGYAETTEIKEKIDLSKVKIDTSKLKGLRKYQIEAVKFLTYHKGNALLGDDMGLGKTIEVLGFLKIHPDIRRVLVLCPTSAKYNWDIEIGKWIGDCKRVVLFGQSPYKIPSSNFYIINYNILDHWRKELSSVPFDLIVSDECQYLANRTTNRTKAFLSLSKNVPCLFMSGTPVYNRTREFFTILNRLDPKQFNNEWKFKWRYCDPSHNGYGWNFDGSSNTKELRYKIQNLMIRRLKRDVLKELPKKTTIRISLECSNPTKYLEQLEKARGKNNHSTIDKQNTIEELKMVAYEIKKAAMFQWIDDFLSTGKKLVIFAIHKVVIKELIERYKDVCVHIDGSVTAEQRQKNVESFQQNSKTKLFLGQLVAAGEAITLTAASTVAHLELGWNAARHKQATDRVDRFGQSANAVFSYYLIARDTIEEEIMSMIEEKGKNLSNLLDGTEKEYFNKSTNISIDDLWEKIRKR